MIVIGLTGGIGTGKSTVSDYLRKKGCIILDADDISRKMTEAGMPALSIIQNVFGDEVINSDGSLNRHKLGDIVFNNRDKLQKLQQIITTEVVNNININLSQLQSEHCDKIAVIDAPLLFECGMENIADENWLVISEMSVRIKRVKERDNLSEEQIIARINNQMSQEDKEKLSDYVLDNSGSLQQLYEQIDDNLERLKDEF